MSALNLYCLVWLLTFPIQADTAIERRVLEPNLRHLRIGTDPEWSSFPKTPEAQSLDLSFASKRNEIEHTLILEQHDVKLAWNVSMNGTKLGDLIRDELEQVVTFAIPAKTLVDGDNLLKIASIGTTKSASDDIRVGRILLIDRPVKTVLRESTIEVHVQDADSDYRLPCRITVLNSNGALQSFGTASNGHLAVRPGVAYTSSGRAKLELPAGQYTIFAGRGFEYSVAQTEVTVAPGATSTAMLKIQREVPTQGYVACDTHVHTLTHSGHGDATIDERMITIAGEGIELPIATDHNCHIDYEEVATRMHLRRRFTPVIGNEVTTPRGHFNIFPIDPGARVVDHKQVDWRILFDEIQQTPGVKVAILNHARDLHSGVRPFGPIHHNAVVGVNLDDWPQRFNAMEVVNSGAIQSQPLQLLHDWMAMLNRGLPITPVGSSDSHDVSRYIVGQGRTYIRCDDQNPGSLEVPVAVDNFVKGRVMVSYGLLADISVNDTVHSGDIATVSGDDVRVTVRVLGPHWVKADHVQLFANGHVIREAMITESDDKKLPKGVKSVQTWTIPKPRHDVHLVAIATGPGIEPLFWRTAKPYQPTSPDWNARAIGCSGAAWLDVDQDGRRTSAFEYAQRLVNAAGNDPAKLIESLSTYDAATAAQAAHLQRVSGTSLQAETVVAALKNGTSATKTGFQSYQEAWRENEVARAER